LQVAELEQTLLILQQKVPVLEKRALSESEVTSLREQLHQEKMQKMLNAQAVTNLEGRVAGLEEQLVALEAQLREKQNALLESDARTREQKNKAQKSKDKVEIQPSLPVEYNW
jgi:predicted S18 family serine protease